MRTALWVIRSRSKLAIALCLGLLCGCAPVVRAPAPGLVKHTDIGVFYDGFHSGLLIPNTLESSFLDPQTSDALAASSFIEVGFGADGWRGDAASSCMATTSLVLWGSKGILLLARREAVRPPRPQGPAVRQWWFSVSKAGWDALLAELAKRRLATPVVVRAPGQVEYLALTDQHWSIIYNCHDSTRDLITVLGLELRESWPGTTGSKFEAVVDAGVTYLQENGTTVLGPETAP